MESAPLLQRLESASAPPTNFVFVGNPGVGKSTLLNCLLGEVHFRSGISIGQGMTYQCDMVEIGQNKFLDTPGLADTKLREQAAEAISQALRQGGNYKVFFVIALQNGRVRAEDITTLRLVLKSAPEIGSQYAIVINQLSKGEMRKLTDPNGQDMETLQSSLMSGMEGDAKPSSFIMLNHRDDDLEDMDDAITPVPSHLLDFVATVVPLVTVHKEKVAEVEHGQFQALSDKVETVLETLREQNALMAAQLRDKDAQVKELQEQLASQSVPSAVPSTTGSSGVVVPERDPVPPVTRPRDESKQIVDPKFTAQEQSGVCGIAVLQCPAASQRPSPGIAAGRHSHLSRPSDRLRRVEGLSDSHSLPLQLLYGFVVGGAGIAGAVSSYGYIEDPTAAGLWGMALDLVFIWMLLIVGAKGGKATAEANVLKLKERASSYYAWNWVAYIFGAGLLAVSWLVGANLDANYTFGKSIWEITSLAIFVVFHPVAIYVASSHKTLIKAAVKDVGASAASAQSQV